MYKRGLPGLGSVREDVPIPQGTGDPREWPGLVGLGHPRGDRGGSMGCGTVRGWTDSGIKF